MATVPIPQPPGWPLVGNITDVDPEAPILSIQHLASQYGEILSLTMFGKRRIFISSHKLLNEVCDEKRFGKLVAANLEQLRHGTHDGLFTAQNYEENWHLAHRILVPAFGPLNITGMFDDMKDIASQLVLKWARYGGDYVIPTTDDFTRLTLDTLALSAMDYRFNSFYTDDMHPFIEAMTRFLKGGGARAQRPSYLASFFRAQDRQFFEDIEYMRTLSREIVEKRIQHPTESKDLLNAMVNGKDPKTGKTLSNETIIDNMITFLIAGHETTSGLLSFLFYYLLKNPEAYRKAQAEVDEVIGSESIQAHHVNELPYITACLRETLRLQPTAPAFTVTPQTEQGEVLGGKYFVEHGQPISVLLHGVHRDPAVYGEDAEEWKPTRMFDENFNKLPPNSWKPFGNGARGCIGRPFAWQEAMMVTAMLLQYFNFAPQDPGYDLQIKSTLTIKPLDFFMRATLREGWTATKVEQSLSGSIRTSGPTKGEPATAAKSDSEGQPITVLYGSNSGTCEAFAQTLAADAGAHGFKATVDTLDSAKQNMPTKQPVVIITASYEGQPCDNAAHFYDWLQNLKEGEKVESSYAVFGCGHSDWKQTFHRIPNSIDALLKLHGGKPVCDRGNADAAKGDMMSDFQTWEDEILWPALRKQFGGADGDQAAESALGQSLSIAVSSQRASRLRADVSEAKVVATRTLTTPDVPEKRHIELQLPTEMTYRAGDYLAVLPLNPQETVHRVMLRFQLPWDAVLTISSKSSTALPTEYPISAHNLFSAYVELGQPATKRSITMLIEASKDDETKKALRQIFDSDFDAEVTEKRVSLLDLLERYPTIELPLGSFVASLISMRVRQYSISSSPLADPNKVTLTYAVLEGESLSGQGRHIGVASHYLSQLQPGDIVHVTVKQSNQAFHLPSDAGNIPVLMCCAGTGLAPFRAFIQERAAQIGAGRKLAPAHLYVGCRHPEKDALYADDLARWEKMEAVTVHRAFSQAPEKSNGFRHMDDVMRADAELLHDLWGQGAKVYVCGSRELGDAVKQVSLDIAKEARRKRGEDASDEVVNDWFDRMRNERYSTDVFA
ncbi:Uu.00g118050.m01.CDS01 [Anthostomella pinea]|uniref:Bifunctional cytochrome P450/NADPH--P450 reductase n=1 Tax=Anthostomella pinea TaxID=933095 RepID=A0AAI8YH04_9PEZI|nr:Uu.00g118050.m01.CDS01 [Anthostomella pinea]